MRYLIIFSAIIAWSVGVHGQSAELRGGFLEILTIDCEAGESAARFRAVANSDPAAARGLFRRILREGPPAEELDAVRTNAAARYDRYVEWAQRNAEKPHAKVFLAGPGRDAFVERETRILNLIMLSNALRGLGLVGDARDRAAIAAAIVADPRLSQIGRWALDHISKR